MRENFATLRSGLAKQRGYCKVPPWVRVSLLLKEWCVVMYRMRSVLTGLRAKAVALYIDASTSIDEFRASMLVDAYYVRIEICSVP